MSKINIPLLSRIKLNSVKLWAAIVFVILILLGLIFSRNYGRRRIYQDFLKSQKIVNKERSKIIKEVIEKDHERREEIIEQIQANEEKLERVRRTSEINLNQVRESDAKEMDEYFTSLGL